MNTVLELRRGGLEVSDEQDAVVAHVLTRPVTVASAGAGTGKTRTTLAAVLELVVQRRAGLEEFALITFTRAAADHLRGALDDAVRRNLSAAEGEERAFWEDQQERSTSAFVGTIHGFCASILRTYGYTERIAREMAVGSSRMLLEEATEAAYEAHLRGGGRLAELDLRGHEVRRLAQDVLDHARTRGLSTAELAERTAEQDEDAGRDFRVEMARLVADIDRRYEALKAERHGLDQTDLLLRTLRLLQGPDGEVVARRVAERHPFLFVDEFQDTDRLQDGILEVLRPHLRGLLVVGDRKQSIYGWRAADAGIMREIAERNGVEVCPLTRSRRATDALLAAQNALFRSMRDRYEEFGETLNPVEDAPPRPRIDGAPIRYVSAGDRARRDDRIATTAREVRRVLEERRMVLPGGDTRALRPGELVVLLRGNENVTRYAAGLHAHLAPYGIRVRAELGGGLYQQPEVVSTCHMLRLILHYPDDTALSMALRTPYLRGVDVSLAEQHILQLGSTEPDPLTSWFQGAAPVPHATLMGLRAAVKRDTVPQLLGRLYEAFDVRGYYRGTGQHRAAENLEKLREVARRMFRNEQALTLRQFVGSLELAILTGKEESEAEAARAEEEELPPYVRVMTVHHSKGLEFPVVVIPEVQAPLGGENKRPAFVVDAASGLDLDLTADGVSVRSLSFGAAASGFRQALLEEEMRILYVAITRAQQAVILVGSGERPVHGPEHERYAWKDEMMKSWTALQQDGWDFSTR